MLKTFALNSHGRHDEGVANEVGGVTDLLARSKTKNSKTKQIKTNIPIIVSTCHAVMFLDWRGHFLTCTSTASRARRFLLRLNQDEANSWTSSRSGKATSWWEEEQCPPQSFPGSWRTRRDLVAAAFVSELEEASLSVEAEEFEVVQLIHRLLNVHFECYILRLTHFPSTTWSLDNRSLSSFTVMLYRANTLSMSVSNSKNVW